MNWLIIQNGIVINAVVADSAAAATNGNPNLTAIPTDAQPGCPWIGWQAQDEMTFTPPE